MDLEFIFVYGTLRREFSTNTRQILVRHCEYFSDGHLRGKLYEVDGYPGVIESDNTEDKVFGELYKIIRGDQVLPQLDDYEQCAAKFPQPHEYLRKKLPISVADGGEVTAWVYVFNHDVSNLIQIESGDYASHIKALKQQ
ncbi:gamma-glutamylcyclotransferase [bacterium]|nr:gamma-glutamylcyclotransferase [bacterium]